MVRETGVQSLPGRVILNTFKKKVVLEATLLKSHHYKERIKGKLSNPEKEVLPLPTRPGWSTYFLKKLLSRWYTYDILIDSICLIQLKWFLRETWSIFNAYTDNYWFLFVWANVWLREITPSVLFLVYVAKQNSLVRLHFRCSAACGTPVHCH